jgi:transcriptional regulator with XRE-family HTH domain
MSTRVTPVLQKYRAVDIGARLGSVRAMRGLSQGTVARLAGLAPSYLSRIETGKIQPTFPTVWRLVAALDTSFDELLGPEATLRHGAGTCPVTGRGQCMLELVRPTSSAQLEFPGYSPRQLRLLHRFATWLPHASAEWLRAMELLLDELDEPSHRS